MVRNLFVLSLLSAVLVGCMGPEKGPSPVTDGAGDANLVPAAGLTPVVAPVVEPAPAPPVHVHVAATYRSTSPVTALRSLAGAAVMTANVASAPQAM